MKIIGEYFIFDGKLLPAEQFAAIHADDQLSVYEVIRLINEVPLFLEMHFFRMINSAAVMELGIHPDIATIACNIRNLARANEVQSGNVRLNVYFPATDPLNYRILIAFVPHRYPAMDEYLNGVPASFLRASRPNPQAKVNNRPLRSKADELIESRNVYEILLVNDRGEVTEGSRSNVFFIDEHTILTPPESDVLPGITRNMVIGICRENGFDLREERIRYEDRESYTSVFITGTSPKILPLAAIDGIRYQPSHPLTRQIMEAYDEKIRTYLTNFDYNCVI